MGGLKPMKQDIRHLLHKFVIGVILCVEIRHIGLYKYNTEDEINESY